MTRGVGDAEFGFGFHHHGLRSHPAGPEAGDLSFPNGDRVSKVRFFEVLNSNSFGIADMNRCPMNQSVTGSDLNSLTYFFRRNGSHGDDHGPSKKTGRLTGNIGDIHGNILFLFDVTNRNPRSKEGLLERETAAQKKGYPILFPDAFYVFDRSLQLTFSVDIIAGKVSPNICLSGEKLCLILSWLQDLKEGTGFGIPLAEEEEVKGIGLREDHEIGLGIAHRQSSRWAIPFPFSYKETNFSG